MSKKVKKQTSSVSFSLSRWFSRISTAKPSTFIVSVMVVVSALFLFSGGLYTVVVKPIPAAYYGQRFYFIYPSLSYQFISDTVISAMLYVIGFVGVLAIYQSTKYAYKPREAYMMLVIGVTLLLLAYIFLEDMIQIKLGR
jgi:hypothetical protein